MVVMGHPFKQVRRGGGGGTVCEGRHITVRSKEGRGGQRSGRVVHDWC
jgi:hypothetical protein